MVEKPSVGIIGAGVIGLSVARSLALAGANVTIFEQTAAGAGTTSTSFGWVNANGKNPDSYYELNLAGMREHSELQTNSSSQGEWYIEAGTYEWHVDADTQELFYRRTERLKTLGYQVEQVSRRELSQRLPDINIDGRASDVAFFPEEGYVHTAILLARLASEARELGVQVQCPVEVMDMKETSTGIQLGLSTGDTWHGDFAVSAVGRWSASIMEMLNHEYAMLDANLPNKFACGFLGYTHPLRTQLRSLLITPDIHMRPDGGGRFILQTFDLDDRADPVHVPSTRGLIGSEMLRRMTALFPQTIGAEIQEIRVGQRAQPADGLPSVGFVTPAERLYMVTTHSGITLAPLLGRLVAEEIVNGTRSSLLHDYSPARLIDKGLADFPGFSGSSRFPGAQ